MIDFSSLSTTKKAVIICGFLLSAFFIGGLIGYVRGAFGDDGSTERAMDWAIKTGLLGIWLIVVCTVFAKVETFLEFELKLPFVASFAIMMGFVIAVIDGSSLLLGITSGEFLTTIFSAFIQGVLSGILGGILIQKF